MKNNKAARIDGIPIELINSGNRALVKIRQELFDNCLDTGETSTNWSKSTGILLYKKGRKCDLKNYRPILLLSHIYKLFMKVITNRHQVN